ncbi:MAG TPA: hypothetical protein VJ872_16070 [Nocardioides sp.]|nr:hypothetical protein [Nocardioides sp.]
MAGGAIEAVGFVGSAGAAVMWVPQAVRVLRLRRSGLPLQGVSAGAYAVAIVFNVLLAWYGLTEHAVPVVVAGTVNLVCAAVIVGAIAVPRRSAGSTS